MARKLTPLEQRLWRFIDKQDGCWTWTGARTGPGYGKIGAGGRYGRTLDAHRVVYELLVGKVPEGLELDHLCRNRACVNPAHLEPVTHAENMRRSPTVWGAHNAAKTHCRNGHAYEGDNLRVTPIGERVCRTCSREACRRHRARRAAKEAS